MIALSLSPVVAWQLLHAGLDVINMPTPAPTEHCELCQGDGRSMFTAFGDCTKCAGSGVGPLRVLIHTTDEHPPIDSLIDFAHNAGYEMRDDMEHLSVWTSPVHGEKKLAGRVMLGAVVAIATITGSHEAKLAQNAGGFHATCCGNSDVPFLPTHHWLVGSVRPITPIPWKPEQSIDCETGALNPVWRVPTELAEQVTT